jgi:hypothetical protein
MPDENSTRARAHITGYRHRDDALQLGPRKKAYVLQPGLPAWLYLT